MQRHGDCCCSRQVDHPDSGQKRKCYQGRGNREGESGRSCRCAEREQ